MTFSSSDIKILSANKTSKIDVVEEQTIQSDSDFREVVKKGYLLNNIALTSVPDVIQDAIDQAKLDAKDITLADDLLTALRLEVDNLNSGVYTKSYVDQQITYLSEAIIQKVSPELVASIVDAKVAIATENLAATSSVAELSSRIGSSESAIATLTETVNTKDAARSQQITDAIAQVDDSLATYSEAIDLTVDENGNVSSAKIETIKSDVNQNVVDITEAKTIAQDANGKWEANAGTLITAPDGTLTGISAKASDSISEVVISADKFKIENAITAPFSIDGTDIKFNGKVSFTNTTNVPDFATNDDVNDAKVELQANIDAITKVEDISWQTEVQDAINNNATTIDGGKIVTNTALVNNLNALGGIEAAILTALEVYGKTYIGGLLEGCTLRNCIISFSGSNANIIITDYLISITEYDNNPSLYTQAEWDDNLNKYTIPTVSNITETGASQSYVTNATSIGSLHSYNVANVTDNLKAAKLRPTISNIEALIGSISCSRGSSTNFSLKLGNLELAKISAECSDAYNLAHASLGASSNYATDVSTTHKYVWNNTLTSTHTYVPNNQSITRTTTVFMTGVPFFGDLSLELESTCEHIVYSQGYNEVTYYNYLTISMKAKVSTVAGQHQIPFDWDNSDTLNVKVNSSGNYNGYIRLAGITVDNLI